MFGRNALHEQCGLPVFGQKIPAHWIPLLCFGREWTYATAFRLKSLTYHISFRPFGHLCTFYTPGTFGTSLCH